MWGLLRTHTPQAGASYPCTRGRTESCTRRIQRMLLRVLTRRERRKRQRGGLFPSLRQGAFGGAGHPRRLVPHWSADD